jgi:hypothetical protein
MAQPPEAPDRAVPLLVLVDGPSWAGRAHPVSDLDGDGRPEVRIDAYQEEITWIFPSSMRGTVDPGAALLWGTGDWRDAGDQDGDGVSDLVSTAGGVRLVSGATRGDLDVAPLLRDAAFSGWYAYPAGDVTGDGQADLSLQGNLGSADVILLEGPLADGGEPTEVGRYVGADEQRPRVAGPADDLDGDGIPDIWISRADQDVNSGDWSCVEEWFLGPAPAVFAADTADVWWEGRLGPVGCRGGAIADDLTGDGHPDVVLATGAHIATVYAGPFVGELTIDAARVEGPAVVAASPGDLDQDGVDDLLVEYAVNEPPYWLRVVARWDGPVAGVHPAESLEVVLGAPGRSYWLGGDAGDVDGDGRREVLFNVWRPDDPLRVWLWGSW